jgi:hypothetical protein
MIDKTKRKKDRYGKMFLYKQDHAALEPTACTGYWEPFL